MQPVVLTTGKKSNNPLTFATNETTSFAVQADGFALDLGGATGNIVSVGSEEEFERAADIADRAVGFGSAVADRGLSVGLEGLQSAAETARATSEQGFGFGVEALRSNVETSEAGFDLIGSVTETFANTVERISSDNSQTAQAGLGVGNVRSILPAENISQQSNDTIGMIAIAAAIAIAAIMILGGGNG